MSGDAQTELHDAVLKALTAALKPVPMFERVPQDQAFPYAAIGDGEVEEWDTTTELGQEHRVMLHVFSRKRGKQECRELLKKIYDALHNQPLTLASGAALVYIYYEFSGITEDPDGKTYWARLKEAKGKRKALREALQPAPRGEPS